MMTRQTHRRIVARQAERAPGMAASALAQRKLRAFARIEAEFLASFRFVEDVHGQRRFSAFPVAETVRYLHALSICEYKDRLLSVPRSAARYEGAQALALLREWQDGETAGVIAFVHRRLDDQPFADLTYGIERATAAGDQRFAARLTSGRAVLLNRLFTLAQALDAIFALDPERLGAEVRAACAQMGHTPTQISRQLAGLRGDLYQYAPEPALARRNMLLMNAAGMRMSEAAGDRPGERASWIQPGAPPAAPYAVTLIPHAWTQISLRWRAGRSSQTFPRDAAPGRMEPERASSGSRAAAH